MKSVTELRVSVASPLTFSSKLKSPILSSWSAACLWLQLWSCVLSVVGLLPRTHCTHEHWLQLKSRNIGVMQTWFELWSVFVSLGIFLSIPSVRRISYDFTITNVPLNFGVRTLLLSTIVIKMLKLHHAVDRICSELNNKVYAKAKWVHLTLTHIKLRFNSCAARHA